MRWRSSRAAMHAPARGALCCARLRQVGHLHAVAVNPLKHAVSAIVGKIKANKSGEIRLRFP